MFDQKSAKIPFLPHSHTLNAIKLYLKWNNSARGGFQIHWIQPYHYGAPVNHGSDGGMEFKRFNELRTYLMELPPDSSPANIPEVLAILQAVRDELTLALPELQTPLASFSTLPPLSETAAALGLNAQQSPGKVGLLAAWYDLRQDTQALIKHMNPESGTAAACLFELNQINQKLDQFASQVFKLLVEQPDRQADKNHFQLLAQLSADVIWTLNLQGKFTFISPSVTRLRGFTPEEAMQQSLDQALTEESAELVRWWLDRIPEKVDPQQGDVVAEMQFELEQPCKDGSTVWTEAHVTLLYDQNGWVQGILGISRDISFRRQKQGKQQDILRLSETLQGVSRQLTSTLDLNEICQLLLRNIEQVIPCDLVTLLLLEGDIARVYGQHGKLEHDDHVVELRNMHYFNISETRNLQIMVESHQPLLIHDVNEFENWIKTNPNYPLRSFLGAPIEAGGKVIGFFTLDKAEPNFFQPYQGEILAAFATHAALALENGRLYNAVQRRAEEAETLYEAGRAVVASLKLDETIARILEQLQRVVPYTSASVQLEQNGELVIVGGNGFANLKDVLGLRFSAAGDNPGSQVFQTRKPMILPNAPSMYPHMSQEPHSNILSWMAIPLVIQDRTIGIFTLDHTHEGFFTPDDARLATMFAGQVAIALENARIFEEIQKMAVTDPLTGLFNRRHFFEVGLTEYERAQRYRRPLSLIMLDIDHFKKINDEHGHVLGDQVLQLIALTCQQSIRKSDLLARYGGEEFILLLPETGLESALQAAERIRTQIASRPFTIQRREIQVTVSLGLVSYPFDFTRRSNPEKSLNRLIRQADTALLTAKHQGRNQTRVYQNARSKKRDPSG